LIKTPTTFVLGAGASHPYGFPLGSKLRNDIIYGCLQPPERLRKALISCGFRDHEIKQFGDTFNGSQLASIDAFLAHRTDFAEVGKAAIAHEILACESTGSLLNCPEGHWYRYLWNRIKDDWDAFVENVFIISFNYDRSLERYFTIVLMHTFKLTEGEARAKVEKLKIVHDYGQVGALGPLSLPHVAEPPFFLPYDCTGFETQLRRAASMIQVIEERKDDSETFDIAEAYVRRARRRGGFASSGSVTMKPTCDACA
jgi:hypothetical protein